MWQFSPIHAGPFNIAPCSTIVPRADENGVADERFADQLAEHRRLQAKLQIARDLFERVPDILLVFEQLRMRRVLETEKFCRAQTCCELSACASRDLLTILRIPRFPAARGEFVAQFDHFFSNLLQALPAPAPPPAAQSPAAAAFLRRDKCEHSVDSVPPIQPRFAASARSQFAVIQPRFVSRIVSNRNPSAAEIFRSSSSASSKLCRRR